MQAKSYIMQSVKTKPGCPILARNHNSTGRLPHAIFSFACAVFESLILSRAVSLPFLADGAHNAGFHMLIGAASGQVPPSQCISPQQPCTPSCVTCVVQVPTRPSDCLAVVVVGDAAMFSNVRRMRNLKSSSYCVS